MSNQGWIKLHRKLLESSIAANPKYLSVFITLLLLAQHEDSEFLHGNELVKLKRGQLLTGRKKLSQLTGINENTLQVILKKLVSMRIIQQQTNNRYRVITILNWDLYQSDQQQNNNKITTNKQQNNTYKNVKNVKNVKKDIPKFEIVEVADKELQEILNFYNQVFSKNTRSTKGFEKNYKEYWRDVHSLENIKRAILSARADKFWRSKMTLTILFRRKNTNGENVDYIEDLSNRPISKEQFSVLGNSTTIAIN